MKWRIDIIYLHIAILTFTIYIQQTYFVVQSVEISIFGGSYQFSFPYLMSIISESYPLQTISMFNEHGFDIRFNFDGKGKESIVRNLDFGKNVSDRTCCLRIQRRI